MTKRFLQNSRFYKTVFGSQSDTKFSNQNIFKALKAVLAAIIIFGGWTIVNNLNSHVGSVVSAMSVNNFADSMLDRAEVSADSNLLASSATENAKNNIKSFGAPITALAPPPSIAAWWKFDEGSGTLADDFSGNDNTGTLVNSPTWSQGHIQGGLNFDGVDDGVNISTSSSLSSLANNFTIAFWAYPTATQEIDGESTSGVAGVGNARYAIYPPQDGATNAGAGVSVGTNGVSVYEHGDGYLPALLVYETPISGWTHVAVVYQNKQPRLYLNGTLVHTGLTSPRSNVLINLACIGGQPGGFGANFGPYSGGLDDVRIYPNVLSASEIMAIATDAPPIAPTTLTAPAASSTQQINLSWADNSNDETGFKIERKTGAGGTYAEIATVAANATSYSNTGLSPSTAYYYRVRAYNANGDSDYSNEVYRMTPANIGTGTGLLGQYFDNDNFTNLKLNRIDPTIAFSWGGGSPDPSIDGDTFSVRWTGQIQPLYSETYTFYSSHDDDIRLWVNGVQLINSSCCDFATSTPIALTAGQKYDIRVDYQQLNGPGYINLSWSSSSQPKEIVPSSQLYSRLIAAPIDLSVIGASLTQINLSWTDNSNDETGFKIERKTGAGGTFAEIATVGADITTFSDVTISPSTVYFYRVRAYNGSDNSFYTNEATGIGVESGTGLLGQYFDNINFTNHKLTRLDPTISFDWGGGSPDPSIDGDTFSVRWTGQIQPLYSETYTFYATSDDHLNLWINETLLLNQDCCTEQSNIITLTAGQRYDIRAELQENGGGAGINLTWSSPNQAKEVISATRLYPNTAPTVSITAPIDQSSFANNSNINITATAADSDGSIVKVEFYQNNILLGEDLSAPYSFAWSSVPLAPYTLTAVATDNLGATTTSAPITIGVAGDNASFVSQTVPTVMTVGETYSISITMRNSGASSWTSDDISPSAPYRLGSENPKDNTTWGVHRTLLPNATTIAPGQDFTFNFSITAPTTSGTYNFQRQMVHDLVAWFGDPTTNVVITVNPAVSGPISHWNFNEGNGTTAADSIGSNNGTLTNNPTWSAAGINGSLRFDGNNLVQAPTVNLPVGNADRTVSAWFRVNSFDGGETFITGYGNFGFNTESYLLVIFNNTRNIVFGQWGDAIFGPVIEPDRWYHVVATNTGDTASLYLDGVLVASRNMLINTSSNSTFYVGRIGGGLGNGRSINGFVDEVQVYNRALSSSEVQDLYSQATPVDPPAVALTKTVLPTGTQQPGANLTFTTTFVNTGGLTANSLVITDPVPTNTDFKLSSVTSNLGTTGLTVTISYSSDNAATWSYTPVSGGGGAPAGYDRSVTNVRYTFAGGLPQTAPNNTGTVSFITRIR